MAGVNRNAPPPTSSGSSGNASGGGGGASSVTQVTGPSSSTTNTSSSQSSSSNSNTSSTRNTAGNKNTTSTTQRDIVTQNMDPTSLAALQDLIASLQQGGTADDQRRMQQIQTELAANTAQRNAYSKESAFADADRASAAAQFEALQDMIPTITAGIDAAGTSGSAMAALLAQDAADNAARASAKLQLDASIAYGQIANQASGNNVELLKIEDPVTNQLLQALEIAKGATQTTSDKSTTKETSNWKEVENTNSSTSSNSRSSSSSTSNTTNSGGFTNTYSNSGNGSTGGSSGPKTTTPTMNYWSTPSSYSASAGR